MEALKDVEGYLLLALQEADKLYDESILNPDQDNPSQDIAKLEAAIEEALNKIKELK